MKGFFIMKEKIMERLPIIFCYYTIITIVCCIYNLFMGNRLIEIVWFVELFAFLVVFNLLDHFINQIDFKSFWTCAIAETGFAYLLFLVFAYCFDWVRFTPEQLIRATVLFVINAALGITYMNYRHKLRAKELNELIQRRNG